MICHAKAYVTFDNGKYKGQARVDAEYSGGYVNNPEVIYMELKKYTDNVLDETETVDIAPKDVSDIRTLEDDILDLADDLWEITIPEEDPMDVYKRMSE